MRVAEKIELDPATERELQAMSKRRRIDPPSQEPLAPQRYLVAVQRDLNGDVALAL